MTEMEKANVKNALAAIQEAVDSVNEQKKNYEVTLTTYSEEMSAILDELKSECQIGDDKQLNIEAFLEDFFTLDKEDQKRCIHILLLQNEMMMNLAESQQNALKELDPNFPSV